MMSPFVAGAIVLTCTFGGALLGMWLRVALPANHLSNEAKETVRLGVGLVATMTALVLGLVTSAAKSSFDGIDKEVTNTAIQLLTLDRTLARYGPETGEVRQALKRSIGERIEMIWPQGAATAVRLDPIRAGAPSEVERLADEIRALAPQNDAQRALQTRALNQAEALLQARWFVIGSVGSSVPVLFQAVLVFWLAITFVSFGLFAPSNSTVRIVLFVCALSVGGAVYLVLEMDSPFHGLVKVSPSPLRYAHTHLGQ